MRAVEHRTQQSFLGEPTYYELGYHVMSLEDPLITQSTEFSHNTHFENALSQGFCETPLLPGKLVLAKLAFLKTFCVGRAWYLQGARPATTAGEHSSPGIRVLGIEPKGKNFSVSTNQSPRPVPAALPL